MDHVRERRTGSPLLTAVPGKDEQLRARAGRADGSRLVFKHWIEEKSSGFQASSTRREELKILRMDTEGGVHSPLWAHEGASVYAQDLSTLYRFDTAGYSGVEADRTLAGGAAYRARRDSASRLTGPCALRRDVDEPGNHLRRRGANRFRESSSTRPPTERNRPDLPEGMSHMSTAFWTPDGKGVTSSARVPPRRHTEEGQKRNVRIQLFVMPSGAPIRARCPAATRRCSLRRPAGNITGRDSEPHPEAGPPSMTPFESRPPAKTRRAFARLEVRSDSA
jgi:hypothetical protein